MCIWVILSLLHGRRYQIQEKHYFKKIKKASRKKPNGALFCAPLDLPVNAKTAPIKASLINSFTVKFQNNTIKMVFLLAFNK